MKHKRILFIILTFSIIFICCVYFTSSLVSHKYNASYYSLIVSTINDINLDINRLEHSDNLYDTLISLTEIKENSGMAVTLISNIEHKSNEFAIGDLLGYMYFFISDIEPAKINEQLLVNVSDDLIEVNTIFSKANTYFIEDKDEYFKLLVTELDKVIVKYPDNAILNLYSSRKTH